MTTPNPNPREVPGPNTPEEMLFDDNLQVFATKVANICALETSGKVPPGQAYKEIRDLWRQLKSSKKSLGIGKPPEA